MSSMNRCDTCGKMTFFEHFCGSCFEEGLLLEIHLKNKGMTQRERQRLLVERMLDNQPLEVRWLGEASNDK